MLKRLTIENFVLFAECKVNFGAGLNVLTGETGAGKSLLLQAVDLITGAKSDVMQIRSGKPSAQLVAEFGDLSQEVRHYLTEALALDIDDEVIIRRVVKADGKSKAFINDVSVTLASLKTLGNMLIARHSQHDQRGLMDVSAHRALIDAELADREILQQVRGTYRHMAQSNKALSELRTQIIQAEKEAHFLKNVVEELGRLAPQPGEEEALVEARNRYLALQKSKEALEAALEAIDGRESISERLVQAQKQLARAPIEEALQASLSDGLERAVREIEEVSAQISDILYAPQEDADSLAEKEDRLFALRAAARKYHVGLHELPGYYEEAKRKIDMFESGEAQLAMAEKQCVAAKVAYVAACEALHAARKHTAETLFSAIEHELTALNMKDAKLTMQQTPLAEHAWGEHGFEQVQFLFAPNKGQGFQPLSKIASGGELSRLLLAISVIMQKATSVACAIYDEIDTGTSGAVAEAIGVRLKKLADKGQVLVVTHLPQVAAQASHHIVIEKSSSGEHTETTLRGLNAKERESELARLLSGKVVTDEAKKAAKKLLQHAG